MKIINYLWVVLFLCLVSTVSSQVTGIKIHASGNYFWLESKEIEKLDGTLELVSFESGDNGFDVGYGLLYSLNSKLEFETDLNFSDRFIKLIDPWGTQQTVKYIGLHQKCFFSLGKILKPYTGLGFNYLIIKRSSADIDFESTRSFYSNFDLSFQAGLVIRIPMVEIFADFHYGINNQKKILRLDVSTEVKVNSKSRLLRVGLAYIIEGKNGAVGKKRKKRKRRW